MHGEQTEMMRLKAALIREYEANDETLHIHSPANVERLELHFRGEKMAKVCMTGKADTLYFLLNHSITSEF